MFLASALGAVTALRPSWELGGIKKNSIKIEQQQRKGNLVDVVGRGSFSVCLRDQRQHERKGKHLVNVLMADAKIPSSSRGSIERQPK